MDSPAQKADDSFWNTKNLNNTGFVMMRLKAGKLGFIASNVLNPNLCNVSITHILLDTNIAKHRVFNLI